MLCVRLCICLPSRMATYSFKPPAFLSCQPLFSLFSRIQFSLYCPWFIIVAAINLYTCILCCLYLPCFYQYKIVQVHWNLHQRQRLLTKGRMMHVVMGRRVLHVLYILLNKKGFFFSEIVPQVRNPKQILWPFHI